MKMPENRLRNVFLVIAAILVLGLAFWGPEWMAAYWDKSSLNRVITEEAEDGGEGFRYTLGSNEKLYILSKCISNQDQQGSYALVANRQEPSEREIAESEIYTVCEEQLGELVRRGILPDAVREVDQASYRAVLYSAIDVLEPRNNLSVWKVSLSTDIRNADKSDRMLDAYIDAETGQIYEFYVRIPSTWEQMDPDKIINAWAEYLELDGREPYDSDNPLLENTPYYKKYRFTGIDEDKTVVTLGFYEGINELFLKISK